MNATGFAARSSTGPLERFDFERRAPRSNDVVMARSDVKYRFVIDMASLKS
jgi:hypothetical protein